MSFVSADVRSAVSSIVSLRGSRQSEQVTPARRAGEGKGWGDTPQTPWHGAAPPAPPGVTSPSSSLSLREEEERAPSSTYQTAGQSAGPEMFLLGATFARCITAAWFSGAGATGSRHRLRVGLGLRAAEKKAVADTARGGGALSLAPLLTRFTRSSSPSPRKERGLGGEVPSCSLVPVTCSWGAGEGEEHLV
jgi:hypothetical protein